MLIDTNLDDFKIRFAEKKDVLLILEFIKELADYEKEKWRRSLLVNTKINR